MENDTAVREMELVKTSAISGMTYEEYRSLVRDLAANGKTTGMVQTEANVNYTVLNDQRMGRWDKTLKLADETKDRVSKMDRKLLFLVLTESWCGDASPSLPVINKIAGSNPNIEFKIVLRDENPELMDAFLTNGAQSIPKLIVFDKEKEQILGDWGPRPSIATRMASEYKQQHGSLTPEFKKDLQMWYNKDKGKNILEDLLALLPLE